MKALFNALKKQLNKNLPCYLVALIESEGSTPRSSGAYMLVGEQGLLYGTIGGGGMEYAAQKLAEQSIASAKSFVQVYDLSPKAGMTCGGSCQVQFCYLPAAEAVRRLADAGESALREHKPWWFLLPLGEGAALPQVRQAVALNGRCGVVQLAGQNFYAEQYSYDGFVYVFGAGHVARELVPLLCHLGFSCIVFDDRKEFADKTVFPMADKVAQVDFKEVANVCALQKNDYAVVMTRGHVHDANVERYLLTTPVGYIGIMGSKGKAELARAALIKEGYSEEQLARVITPIGISIGSETPAEIAVSIAAQLIKVRSERI